MKLLIPVSAGLEICVKRQLKQLGYVDCPAVRGRVSLEGDFSDVARLNVFLRAGDRVLIELASFRAETFDALFDGVFSVPWEEYLSPHARIRMDGKSVGSKLGAVKAAGGVAKKAILKRLAEKTGVRTFDERGPRAVVGVSLWEDVATVTLDTSGEGLHKRGYRVLSYDAPLRETTAAGMVDLTFYSAKKPLADLFCGSGTIPIEAALYALRAAPCANREFDFTSFLCAPEGVLARAREEAADVRLRGKIAPVYASDISERAVSVARYHARRAGVEEHISFRVADMREFSSEEKYGVLLSNPPYGERLKGEDLYSLYGDFARTFRRLPDWSCYFLTSYPLAERAFGMRADARRTLSNARLACTLYSHYGKKPPKEEAPNAKDG